MAVFDPTTPDMVWYPIPSAPGYELGSDLSIRSFLVPGRNPDGSYGGIGKRWRRLRIYPNASGYQCFTARVNGKTRPIYLHHAVCEVIYGDRSGPMILHGDDDKSNCYPSNLQFGDQSANMRDAVVNGGCKIGEENPSSRLTAATVREIRRLIEAGWTHRRIAAVVGTSICTVSKIRGRSRWAHVV